MIGVHELAQALPQLCSQAAAAIGAACSLAFGPGAALLEALPTPQGAMGLEVVGGTAELLTCQLAIVEVTAALVLHPERQPQAAAAFASGACQPGAMMPWLFKLCRALAAATDASCRECWFACRMCAQDLCFSLTACQLCCHPATPADDEVLVDAVSNNFLALMRALLSFGPYVPHREWLAAHPDCQQAVVDVLLQWCVPFLAASLPATQVPTIAPGSAGQQLQLLSDVLPHPSLTPAFARLRGAAALAAVQSAAALIEALPAPRAASMDAGLFSELHAISALLLQRCCFGLHIAAEESGGSTSASGAGSSQQQVAAWRLVALVPKLAAAIQALADEPQAAAASLPGQGAGLARLEATCANAAAALQLLAALKGQSAGAKKRASWAAAVMAGLRLQPTLCMLDARLRQGGLHLGGGGRAALDGAEKLSEVLLEHAKHRLELYDASDSNEGALSSPETAELWELHTTAARLCHFRTSQPRPSLPAWRTKAEWQCWATLMLDLYAIFEIAWLAMTSQLNMHGGPRAGGPAQ